MSGAVEIGAVIRGVVAGLAGMALMAPFVAKEKGAIAPISLVQTAPGPAHSGCLFEVDSAGQVLFAPVALSTDETTALILLFAITLLLMALLRPDQQPIACIGKLEEELEETRAQVVDAFNELQSQQIKHQHEQRLLLRQYDVLDGQVKELEDEKRSYERETAVIMSDRDRALQRQRQLESEVQKQQRTISELQASLRTATAASSSLQTPLTHTHQPLVPDSAIESEEEEEEEDDRRSHAPASALREAASP